MLTTPLMMELEELQRRWGWLLALGILLIILGTTALVLVPAATLATVLVLGWLMVFSGAIEAIQGFRQRKWGGVVLHLIVGLLGVLVGLLIVTHPLAGALAWTLLLASFFVAIGLFRTIAAIQIKFPNWGWALFDGLVTLGLGIMLWVQWPWSGFWFLGLALGVTLILRGWSYVMLAIAIRSLRRATEARPVEIRSAA